MKQKIVLKVSSMNEPKTRSKAMKLVAGFPGVLSAALQGDDKSEIAVVGEEVDSVCLTRCLRKRIGHTELVSLGEDKKEEKKEEKKPKDDEPQKPVYLPSASYHIHEVHDPQPGCENCSLM